jgi:hypothetical protein
LFAWIFDFFDGWQIAMFRTRSAVRNLPNAGFSERESFTPDHVFDIQSQIAMFRTRLAVRNLPNAGFAAEVSCSGSRFCYSMAVCNLPHAIGCS